MIKMLYVAGIANLLRVGVEEGEHSSFSRRQCYSARHPHAIRLAMDWRPWDLRAGVRGEAAASAAGGGLDRLPLRWGEGADRYHRQAVAVSRGVTRCRRPNRRCRPRTCRPSAARTAEGCKTAPGLGRERALAPASQRPWPSALPFSRRSSSPRRAFSYGPARLFSPTSVFSSSTSLSSLSSP